MLIKWSSIILLFYYASSYSSSFSTPIYPFKIERTLVGPKSSYLLLAPIVADRPEGAVVNAFCTSFSFHETLFDDDFFEEGTFFASLFLEL